MTTQARTRLWTLFESLFAHELTETTAQAPQPEWCQTPLLPHQRTSLAAALQLESLKTGGGVGPVPGDALGGLFSTNYGILGDRVGSGKSLLSLALVKQLPPPAAVTEHEGRCGHVNMVRMRDQTRGHGHGRILEPVTAALFVIPHPLMSQWEDYVRNDTQGLRVCFIRKRKDISDNEATLEAQLRAGHLDAVFVSSTMWRDFHIAVPAYNFLWSRIFIDEADTIKVSLHGENLQGRFVWLITASWINLVFAGGAYFETERHFPPLDSTPAHVRERMEHFLAGSFFNIAGVRNTFVNYLCGTTQLSYYNSHQITGILFQLSRLVVRCSEEFIRRSFAVPSIQHVRVLCQAPQNVRVLKDMISDEMMERLHAGDSGGVLEMLGMTTTTGDQVIEAVNRNLQTELGELRRLRDFKATVEYSSEGAKTKSLQALGDKISRLENRITAIEQRINTVADQTCPICFSDVGDPAAITPCCRNAFCFGCICAAFKHNSVCPLCREPLESVQSLQVISAASAQPTETVPVPQLLTKSAQFMKIVREQPEGRILVFSGYDATFETLMPALEAEGVSCAVLQGSSARIARLLKAFGEGKYRVMFLNSRNMGAGLNITSASHIVLYHHMPVETQHQIIGRAMRIGRTRDICVYHLLHGVEMRQDALMSVDNDNDNDRE